MFTKLLKKKRMLINPDKKFVLIIRKQSKGTCGVSAKLATL